MSNRKRLHGGKGFCLYVRMNYLAHACLSFDDTDILTGNMISDFVKGKKKFEYPQMIQNGISLHRMIDEYTDCHPQTARAKSFFRAAYRLYSGPFTDIVYDHFLARSCQEFDKYGGIANFVSLVYDSLTVQSAHFPPPFHMMFPYMKQQDWLGKYQYKEGIQQSFRGLVRRALYLKESETAFEIFIENYEALQECFTAFYPQLKTFAFQRYKQLIGS